jgi:hypothetical protein
MIHAARELMLETTSGSKEGATSLHIRSILVITELIWVRLYEESDIAEISKISNDSKKLLSFQIIKFSELTHTWPNKDGNPIPLEGELIACRTQFMNNITH